MLTYQSLAFTVLCLSASACAATAEDPEGGTTEDALSKRSKTVQVDTAQCPDYYDEGGVRTIAPGTKLVLTSPGDHEVQELFGLPPELVPGWSLARKNGNRVLTVKAGPTPIELFSGVSRIMTTGPTGSHTCYFDVRTENVLTASTFEWLDETSTPIERDLGEVSVGGTLLLEASPFGNDPQNQTTLLEREGDAVPTRVTPTSVDYGNGTYVFEASEPGDFQVDVRVVIAGYSNHVSRVHWHVTPR